MMIRKWAAGLSLALTVSIIPAPAAFAVQSASHQTAETQKKGATGKKAAKLDKTAQETKKDGDALTLENSGAYLFTWRPVDVGNGQSFAILVGQNKLEENDVILSRGYDYAYTFDSLQYARPWGTVPDLVNVNGLWGIPENWGTLGEGVQPTARITLITNNGNLATRERYVDVVHLPNGTDASALPPEVRKYLINTDGSDAGAYNGTVTQGWVKENGGWRYRRTDGSYISGGWIKVDDQYYYIGADGFMLADTITPDGVYVNAKGERTGYLPGWAKQDDGSWKYVLKNGYYAASTWVQDADGKYYYFDIAGRMTVNEDTPDGYHVGADGVWDGNPSTAAAENQEKLGPGAALDAQRAAEAADSDDAGAAQS